MRRRASPGQFVSSVRWRKYATAAAIRCGWNMLPVYRDWQLSITHRLCLILPDARSSASRRILIGASATSFYNSPEAPPPPKQRPCQDRKHVEWGKSVNAGVTFGGRGYIKKK